MSDLLKVTAAIERAHPVQRNYPLLPGDVLTRSLDGTYVKHAPGLGVAGFVLTPEQEATLEPTEGQVVLTKWGDPDLHAPASGRNEP